MFQDDGNIRVIEGPEQEAEAVVGNDGEFDIKPDVVASIFKKFVSEFKVNVPGEGFENIVMKYRDQFQQNCSQGYYYLELHMNDLDIKDSSGEILAHCLKQKPSLYLPIIERSLQELYHELVKKEGDDLPSKAPVIQLLLSYDVDLEGSFGTMKPMKIRQLTSDQVEKLVTIQGIVVSAKTARHKARKICLKCSNCENYKEIRVGVGHTAAHIPAACDGNSLRGPMEKCPPRPFVVVDDLCEYVDEQLLKLQELPDHVPIGEMPRHVDLCVSQYLVDRASPGARLTAVGVYMATEHSTGDKMGGARMRGTDTIKYSYMQVLGASVSQGGAVETTPEEEEEFDALAKDSDIRSKIYKSIAPAIRASEKDVIDDVKCAVACLLFGGSRKLLPDGTRMRGDINVLLLGDPGTAKSQFLKFSEKAAPVAVFTSGKGSSAAGLTAAIVRDGKDGFALEGGAMVLADGGIVCIDEFDKMDVNDRVAIHEAMEQQTISIAKAGITTMLNTRCAVLAAANPRFGTYDDLTNTADQMDFEATILSRFDMMFLVKDVRDPDRDYALALHLASLHKGEVQQEAEGPFSVSKLRKYLSYCRRRVTPRLTPAAGELLKNHYVSIRAKMKQEKESGKNSGVPITVRQLEAIIRISESLAKMELCEDVNTGHVEEALRLFTVSTLDSANNDRGVGVDSLTEQEKEELHIAEEHIRRRVQRGGRINRYQLEAWLVSSAGVEERMARRAVHLMLMRQEFLERANFTLQRV